ncbi:P-loop NTPase fold protein [Aureibaculum sp. 2210JD6-5]|uniref:KAP family P-loop NTPase fold protein n=1 Tax=Aureibaculum sp. 2210JD6-5 TaxID=3103957 RepID=UPI002AAC5311|nr:P-loop NTPase fold protein [Aureibaculum sp. 2210JD6-5]MDY7395872.1 P-loop NTPase fold protein [Aureibaculum sp. 2210JD6-5]
MDNNVHVLGDSAIEKPEEDLFNFRHYAEKVKFIIQRNANNPNPITIGIYGKWGEGKTSFLNLIEHKLDAFSSVNKKKGILKYHFNPWRYSNEDEMSFDFYDGLSKLMFLKKEKNLKKVGETVVNFSRYLKSIKLSSSFSIPLINKNKVKFEPGLFFEALGEDLKGDELTLDILKEKVNEALEKANYKVVVFIDDLDRLDKDEIYSILKLIKLNANFRDFIYIITLDSEQVSKAISKRYGEDSKDGFSFLEKIINIPLLLPRIEKEDLKLFFEFKLKETKRSLTFIDNERKELEFSEIAENFRYNYFKSPREILRVINSFFISAFAIGDDVHLSDLFWLEYIKIKNEKCYNILKFSRIIMHRENLF